MAIQTLLLKGVNRFISKADTQAASDVVSKLRQESPEATTEEIVDQLIRRKCRQAGSIGAVTSGAAIIPGLGTVAAMTFGVAADIGMTFKLQAEMVLEIAHAYGRELDEEEKHKIILSITGISAGSQAALQKAGQSIAAKATAQLAQKSISKAIPFLGVAASGGTNILTTYIIGRRAQAYFSLGPDQMEDWKDGLRAISGVDEEEIIEWLDESAESSWQMISSGSQAAADSVIVTGKSTGTAVVVYSQKAAQTIVSSGNRLFGALKDGATSIWPFGSESTSESPEEPKVAEEGGIFASIKDRFTGDDAEKEIDLATVDHEELLKKLPDAKMTDEKIIGMVGAGDEIDGELAPEDGYLERITELFAWRRENKSADDEPVDELYKAELPSTMVVINEEKKDGKGILAKVVSVFTRE